MRSRGRYCNVSHGPLSSASRASIGLTAPELSRSLLTRFDWPRIDCLSAHRASAVAVALIVFKHPSSRFSDRRLFGLDSLSLFHADRDREVFCLGT
jgi:hypothetical protein